MNNTQLPPTNPNISKFITQITDKNATSSGSPNTISCIYHTSNYYIFSDFFKSTDYCLSDIDHTIYRLKVVHKSDIGSLSDIDFDMIDTSICLFFVEFNVSPIAGSSVGSSIVSDRMELLHGYSYHTSDGTISLDMEERDILNFILSYVSYIKCSEGL